MEGLEKEGLDIVEEGEFVRRKPACMVSFGVIDDMDWRGVVRTHVPTCLDGYLT
jgi:hypothetical protein